MEADEKKTISGIFTMSLYWNPGLRFSLSMMELNNKRHTSIYALGRAGEQ